MATISSLFCLIYNSSSSLLLKLLAFTIKHLQFVLPWFTFFTSFVFVIYLHLIPIIFSLPCLLTTSAASTLIVRTESPPRLPRSFFYNFSSLILAFGSEPSLKLFSFRLKSLSTSCYRLVRSGEMYTLFKDPSLRLLARLKNSDLPSKV